MWLLAAGAGTLAAGADALAADARKWKNIEADGLHDPKTPALSQLQQPSEALSKLPPDRAGNQVNWGQALEKGLILPRSNIFPETKFNLYDTTILLNRDGSLPLVRFPHKEHTLWLDCGNCHDKLFKMQAGANKYSMLAILDGEQCGVCHGAVAFPLTECRRCHNTPHAAARAPGAKP